MKKNIKTINSSAVFIDLMEIEKSSYNYYCNVLNNQELTRLEEIKHPLKKLEYAAARFLKHKRFGNQTILYDHNGAPHIENGPFISLSHSKSHVVLAFCEEHPVGVDIELISEKSVLTQRRFITPLERELFDCHTAAEMTLLWSLKETMYKLSDRNELLFQEHLLIKERANFHFSGQVLHRNGFVKYKLEAFEFPTFFITCNAGEGEKA